MLHILNKRPESLSAANMLRVVGDQDEVLLIEQAVQASLLPQWAGFEQCRGRLYLLSDDLEAAGLLESAENLGAAIISMTDFVTLTERHEQCVSWY
ncbi:sulfurtransferase complex subunit TusB [Vreelandella sp. EE27]